MSVITRSNSSLAGGAITFVAASGGGDTFVNEGNTQLHVKNGSGAPITVTINSTQLCSFGFDHNLAVVVAAGAHEVIGPFPVARFGRSVAVTYSGVTTLTVAAVGT